MSHLLLRCAGALRVQQPSILRSASALPLQLYQHHPATSPSLLIPNKARTFSTDYMAQKKAAKEKRRQLYEAREQRKERLITRQKGRPERGQKKVIFRSWFIKKKIQEEYMARKARQAGLDWKIRVAVILERMNVVLPDKQDWEIEFEKLTRHLQQFGKQYPKGLYPAVNYESERAITDEELMALLPKGFKPAPRETAADLSGDVKTLDRKLKTSVYLTVQQDDDKGLWELPTVELKEHETLVEAAKRAIPEMVGDKLVFWCPSNCPCAVNMVAFPEDDRKDGFYGTKTFFMKVQYDEGAISDKHLKIKDYAWLDRNEVADRIKEQQGDYESTFYRYLL